MHYGDIDSKFLFVYEVRQKLLNLLLIIITWKSDHIFLSKFVFGKEGIEFVNFVIWAWQVSVDACCGRHQTVKSTEFHCVRRSSSLIQIQKSCIFL